MGILDAPYQPRSPECTICPHEPVQALSCSFHDIVRLLPQGQLLARMQANNGQMVLALAHMMCRCQQIELALLSSAAARHDSQNRSALMLLDQESTISQLPETAQLVAAHRHIPFVEQEHAWQHSNMTIHLVQALTNAARTALKAARSPLVPAAAHLAQGL